MESYYNLIKINKIKKLLASDQKEEAYKLAVTIAPGKIKNVMDMITLADAFSQNKEYRKAKELFWKVYEKTGSKRALSQMLHLTIKSHEIMEAEKLLKIFEETAPDDSYRLIFRFQIERSKQASNETLIQILEQLKNEDYMEHWAYELAKLYHKAGEKEKCINECNDIILWFGEGEYVEWAKVLKGHHMGEIDITQMQQRQEEITLAKEVKIAIEGVDSFAEEYSFDGEEEDSTNDSKGRLLASGITAKNRDADLEQTEDVRIYHKKTSKYSNDLQEIKPLGTGISEKSETAETAETTQNTETAELPETTELPEITEIAEATITENTALDSETEVIKLYDAAPDSLTVHRSEQGMITGISEEESEKEKLRQQEEEQEAIEREAIRYIEELFKSQAEEEVRISSLPTAKVSEDEIVEISAGLIERTAGNETEAEESRTKETEEQDFAEVLNELERAEAEPEPVMALVTDTEFESVEERDTADMTESEVPAGSSDTKIADMNRYEQLEGRLNENGRLTNLLNEAQLSLDELFGNYTHLSSVRNQLLRTLDTIFDGRKKNLNLIITGGSHCGKTILAKRLAKMMYRFQELKTVRIAIISADKLNRLDIKSKKDQLMDCCLIIQNAGRLSKTTVDSLLEQNTEFLGHTAVILEDSRNNMNRLLRDNKDLGASYQMRIHLPNFYKAEELNGFAYDYFLERDYEITEAADRVLKELINTLHKQKNEDIIGTMNEHLRAVIEKAEKRAAKSLLELAASGKFEESDIMVIKEEDFRL